MNSNLQRTLKMMVMASLLAGAAWPRRCPCVALPPPR
jgi:hypothetical protein